MNRFLLLAGTAVLAAGCAQTPAATSSPPSTVAAVPRIEPSPAVREAQSRLGTLGFYSGPVDGVWGPATQDAVTRFQRSRGLVADGLLGDATATALRTEPPVAATRAPAPSSRLVELNDPTSVRTVQNRLRQLGFYDGPADGVWGPTTQQGIERFQRARGMSRVGDVNEATLSAMGIDPASLSRTASTAEPLDPTVVRGIQRRLRELGFYRGPLDGTWGSGSQAAVERFQRRRGLDPSGELTPATLSALGLDPNNLASTAGSGSSRR